MYSGGRSGKWWEMVPFNGNIFNHYFTPRKKWPKLAKPNIASLSPFSQGGLGRSVQSEERGRRKWLSEEKRKKGGGWRKEEVEEVPCNNGGKRRKQGRHYSSSRGGRRSVRSKHAFHKHTIGRTDGVVALLACSVPTLRMDVAGTKQERENGKKKGKSGRGGLRKKERKKNSREWATSWQKERMRKGERRSFTRTKKCWLLE